MPLPHFAFAGNPFSCSEGLGGSWQVSYESDANGGAGLGCSAAQCSINLLFIAVVVVVVLLCCSIIQASPFDVRPHTCGFVCEFVYHNLPQTVTLK